MSLAHRAGAGSAATIPAGAALDRGLAGPVAALAGLTLAWLAVCLVAQVSRRRTNAHGGDGRVRPAAAGRDPGRRLVGWGMRAGAFLGAAGLFGWPGAAPATATPAAPPADRAGTHPTAAHVPELTRAGTPQRPAHQPVEPGAPGRRPSVSPPVVTERGKADPTLWPVGGEHQSMTFPGTNHRADPGVVVRRGDTLWDLAAGHLGPHPSDAVILRAVARWYDLNRSVVGPNPDLIRPGQVLRIPDNGGFDPPRPNSSGSAPS